MAIGAIAAGRRRGTSAATLDGSAMVSRSNTAFSGTNPAAVTWDTEVYDNGGLFTIASPTIFTVQSSGLYKCAAAIYSNADQSFWTGKNGSTTAFNGSGTGLTVTSGSDRVSLISAIFSASASDTLCLFKSDTSTTAPQTADGNWFGVEKLDSATQYALAVRISSSQSLSGATVLSYDTEVADVGNWFAIGSPTLMTVPSGVTRIRLSAGILTNSAAGNFPFWISKGDGSIVRGLPVHGESYTGNKSMSIASAVIAVTAGDTFKVNTSPANATSTIADGRVYFCAEEVPNYARTLAYRSASLSIIGSSTTTLAFDSTVTDTAGALSGGVIVVPSGYTQMRVGFSIDGPDGTNDFSAALVRVSDSLVVPGAPAQETNSSQSWVSSMGTWIAVTAGENYKLAVTNNGISTFTLADSNNTWICAEFR